MRRFQVYPRVVSLVVLALLLAAAGPALAGNSKPRIVPIDEEAYGKSYEEWSTAWWQWALSLPVTDHPLFDTTGEDCDVGQKGKVWFLGGVFNDSGEATRHCTIPNGKALFFPILNSFSDNIGVDPPLSAEELVAITEAGLDNPDELAVTIDGKPVPNEEGFRIEPTFFFYTLPDDDSLLDFIVPDNDFPNSPPEPGAVSSGYFLLLQPLAKGDHVVRIQGTTKGGFSLDVTYHLTVSKSRQKGK